jgi:hypothetical protein
MTEEVIVEEQITQVFIDDVYETAVIVEQALEVVAIAEQGPPGAPGAKGDKGDRGAPGTSGGLKFIHTQSSASDEWIVNHNLGERPMVEVRSAGGQVIDAEVLHVSDNQLRVYFSTAFSGQVRCL